MELGYLLLIILAVWLVPKLIRGYLFVHRIKKQARTMYEQMYNNNPGTQQQQRRSSRRPGWSAPTQRRKKIDPEVGEYVKFQEITVTETTQQPTGDTPHTSYPIEQQITDAEWEDIK